MKIHYIALFLVTISNLSYAACAGSSVYEEIACYEKQYKADKTELNKTYQSLYKSFDATNQKLLENSQKAWLNYREIQCNQLLSNLSKDAAGAGIGLINLSCNANLTHLRIKELKGLKLD